MTYEVIHEIFNSCSGNQMRDIFFDEKDFESVEDLEKYVRAKHDARWGIWNAPTSPTAVLSLIT